MIIESIIQLMNKGKMEDALQLISENLPDPSDSLYYELMLRKIHILESMSNPVEASDILESTLSLLYKRNYESDEANEQDNLVFHYLLTKATINVTLGNNKIAERTLDGLHTMVESNELDQFLISKYYTVFGNFYLKIGKIQKALGYQLEGLDFIISHNLQSRKLVYWNNIGIIYIYQGLLDKALQYFSQALDYLHNNEVSLEYEMTITMNIGRTHYYMGNLNLARNHLETALEIGKHVERYETIVETLFHLILVEAEQYGTFSTDLYNEMIDLPHNNNPRILLLWNFMKAYKFRFGGRVHDMVKAQDIFREIIQSKIIDHQIHNMALLNFAELLFDEMDKFGVNQEIIDDLDTTLSELISASKKEHIYKVYTQSLVLQAKIKILQKDATGAIETFNEALIIAKTHGLSYISKTISEIYDQSLPILTSLLTGESDQSLREIYRRIDPQLTVRIMRQFQTQNQLKRELPILFLIINPGMSLSYSLKFNDTIQADENLIGNFLTALNSFGETIFETRNRIHRIQIGDYTIIFQPYNNYLFSYTFKGPSFPATAKMDEFLKFLIQSDAFQNYLIKPSLIINEIEFRQHLKRIFDHTS